MVGKLFWGFWMLGVDVGGLVAMTGPLKRMVLNYSRIS